MSHLNNKYTEMNQKAELYGGAFAGGCFVVLMIGIISILIVASSV